MGSDLRVFIVSHKKEQKRYLAVFLSITSFSFPENGSILNLLFKIFPGLNEE